MGLELRGYKNHNEGLERKKSRFVIVSAIEGHPLDGTKGDGSPFTNALIKNLLENKQESLSASELIVKLRKDMFLSGDMSLPALGALKNTNHQGGEFCFKLKDIFVSKKEDSQYDKVNFEEQKLRKLQESLETLAIKLEMIDSKLIERVTKPNPATSKKLDKRELLNLVKENKIETFFSRINELQEQIEESKINTLIMLQNQWASIKNQNLIGTVNFQTVSTTKNKIKQGIIEITNSLS